ncbi:class I SAM-dependent methyltransferase [Natronobacterium texcoconense]|uniref:Methyltransferase domain-containing protein n=1 Tax=Natronobacterium texcoconense TaxID=1095778 RepID=A0A1H1IBS2_NATTX|nr:class I SAM-dependent methyltransferase [Natronobacterium texcoconense]SDR35029.1 Methyltransferase domain-containing protein [Natronobacterium texcoconense]
MSTTGPFETLTDEYDSWFSENDGAYRAERATLERALPDAVDDDRALEVGVGTGRFGGPLEISLGVDPAREPLERARDRGIIPVRGVAESLPVADDALDLVLFVTVLSFVDDLEATLAEARRVLDADGTLVVAVLDRSSPVGQVYQEHKDESPFYADAEFLTAGEAGEALEAAGFVVETRLQTIFEDPAEIPTEGEPDVREGHGDGLFAVFRARVA